VKPNHTEPYIRRFSNNSFRVVVTDPQSGKELQEYFCSLNAARTWRDAMLELRDAARQLGAQRIQKASHAVAGFPVGLCPCTEKRNNKDGTSRTYHYVRSTLHLNTGQKKTHRAKYGKNRTLKEAIGLALEKRQQFCLENPDLLP